mmetsp:Transcript_27691/g.54073  ORF Transcript_27691/g.54073 Transcript_27691/m.54073 type:complete len:748 (-) Transcript_27691:510-2753(-)
MVISSRLRVVAATKEALVRLSSHVSPSSRPHQSYGEQGVREAAAAACRQTRTWACRDTGAVRDGMMRQGAVAYGTRALTTPRRSLVVHLGTGNGSGQHRSHSSRTEGKGGKGFGFGRYVLVGTVVCGGGAGAYVLSEGATARSEARVAKEEWMKLRDRIEREVGEGEHVSIWQALPRMVHLGVLFFPLMSLSVPTLAITWCEDNSPFFRRTMGWAGNWMRSLWLLVLRLSLERSGAAFIKWGQWAATRPDIFPRSMCTSMQSLHDAVPPHAWHYTEDSLKRMYNVEDIGEVFEEFVQKPIGSGSIAQVYRAKIKGVGPSDSADGWVAVKVRHPGVERQLLTDFALLKGLGDVLHSVPQLQWLGLKESLKQFEHTLGVQVRLDFEAANLDLFNANFRACPQVTTIFPSPRSNCPSGRKHVSDDVLVESFESGHSVSSYCAAAAAQALVTASRASRQALTNHGNVDLVRRVSSRLKEAAEDVQLAVANAVDDEKYRVLEARETVQPLNMACARHVVQTGKETYLQMLLVDNFIHADMHPGNIIVRMTPGAYLPTLVLIDAGMVDVMGPIEQDNFIGLFKAMGSGNGEVAAGYLLKFSKSQDDADAEGFTRHIKQLFNQKCRGFGTDVDVGEVLQGILDALRRYKVRVDGNYATSVVNLLCVEGVAAALDPSYNLLDESETLLYAHTMLGRERLAWCMAVMAPILSAARNLRTMAEQSSSKASTRQLLRSRDSWSEKTATFREKPATFRH